MKKKILIADDDKSVTDLLKAFLQSLGLYEVQVAYSGDEAFAKAQIFSPDLILTDINMPDSPGDVFAANLKLQPGFEKTIIIFMTGMVSEEEVELDHGQIGGRLYLAKPFNLTRVKDTIAALFNPTAPESQAATSSLLGRDYIIK